MTPMQPTKVRCEYFVNPIGIDAREPRLSWQIGTPRQSAYQVVVADLWDSGKVESEQSIHIEYRGPALKSRQRCEWKVRVWDGDGQPSPWSEAATFEMGLLGRGDWKGKWIGSHVVGGPYTIPPAPHLRKAFSIAGPVKTARLYVTALGLYEFSVNGRRVGDAVLTPGRTEYGKRVPYHVFDVTSMLRAGENACGAILGDGWFCGHLHSDPRQTYGDRPRLLAQIFVEFSDGSSQIVATDDSWEAGEGAIRSSDLLMGEDIDARLEPRDWRPVMVFDDPGIEIVAHRAPPMRKCRSSSRSRRR
jgi:alpha-L-rhamnosidase